MIKSMTGFGIGSTSRDSNRYNIEIKSVNARFLDIKFRGIQLDLSVEDEIKKIIKKKLHRGTINIRIDSDLNNNSNKISFNQEKYEMLKGILKDIHIRYGQPMNMSDIISSGDLLKLDEPKSPSRNVILKAVESALGQLQEMRNIEGTKISEDTSMRISRIKDTLDTLEEKAGSYKYEKQDKLRLKISAKCQCKRESNS